MESAMKDKNKCGITTDGKLFAGKAIKTQTIRDDDIDPIDIQLWENICVEASHPAPIIIVFESIFGISVTMHE